MYARMNGTVIVTCARSGSTAPSFLMHAEDVVPAAGVEPAEWSRSSYRISSISNAARIVSISTVARIEPRGMPSASSASANASFQSRASRWLSSFGR